MSSRRITHVALRWTDPKGQVRVFNLPPPNRHHDIIRLIVNAGLAEYVDAHGDDQGFLDSDGKYLTRGEAYVVAKEAGQLRADRPNWNDELYSENLW